MLATSHSHAQENFGDRTERELTILLYHGVTNSPGTGIENYSGKHIPADDFTRQMRTIRRHCTVLSPTLSCGIPALSNIVINRFAIGVFSGYLM